MASDSSALLSKQRFEVGAVGTGWGVGAAVVGARVGGLVGMMGACVATGTVITGGGVPSPTGASVGALGTPAPGAGTKVGMPPSGAVLVDTVGGATTGGDGTGATVGVPSLAGNGWEEESLSLCQQYNKRDRNDYSQNNQYQ